jgi:hypothetical protein
MFLFCFTSSLVAPKPLFVRKPAEFTKPTRVKYKTTVYSYDPQLPGLRCEASEDFDVDDDDFDDDWDDEDDEDIFDDEDDDDIFDDDFLGEEDSWNDYDDDDWDDDDDDWDDEEAK